MIQETAHEWAVHNFTSGLRGGRHARRAARLRPRRPRGAARSRSSAGTARASPPTRRRGDPAADARRAPQPRHGGDRAASSRRSARSRPCATAATAPTTRRSPICSSSTAATWFERLARDRAVGRRARARARAAPHAGGRGARRGAHRRRRLHRPEVAVHGRSQPALRAARRRRRPRARALRRTRSTALRRAALVHDFGTTAVRTRSGTSPGALTRTEFDRVELHPMLTEQMLRRSPALAALNPVASAHHEKCDGSGLPQARRGPTPSDLGRVRAGRDGDLRRADHRARRPSAVRRDDAAAELRRLEAEGVLEPRATRAVLVAAGHGEPAARTRQAAAATRRPVPARGRRARLAARGLTTRADRRPARHLAQDRRPPHPAHLRQDRRVDAGRRRAVGDAARRRSRLRINRECRGAGTGLIAAPPAGRIGHAASVSDGISIGEDGRPRCSWGTSTPDYVAYHDTEWGFPVADDRRLFEKICLEGFQSGLSLAHDPAQARGLPRGVRRLRAGAGRRASATTT